MSSYSDVTEQNLVNLRKLAEQQKNQRAPKLENGIFKQTHDQALAESLSPITKKLDEVKQSTQKLGEFVKENNTPQLTIKNTQNALAKENEQTQLSLFFDTSLENTLNNMKKILFF